MKKTGSRGEQVKPVGIWIRVSTEDQARGESPEHHEKRARMYAEVKGWRVREVYHLEALSGKSVMGYPETQRMLKDVRAGHISGLIFSKLARLARNTRELLDFADIFRECDADLVSLHESIDTSTPAGRLFYTMIAAMAQWEREEISERVAASVPIRAKLGKPLGGAAPFGYRWLDRDLVPDPKEAPVRKLIYELYLEHRRKKTVARLLNERGHRTRNGSKFTDTTIDRLLRDTTAKGIRRANYTKSLGEKKNWKLKDRSEWVLTPVEPLITEELWTQVNAILEGNRGNGKRLARKPKQLFTGVVFCSCGENQKMYVPSNTPKYVCYKCRTKIPTGDLEAVFAEELKNYFLDPKELTAHLAQGNQQVKDREERLAALAKEQAKVVRSMNKIQKAYMEDALGMDGYRRQYRPLEERLKQIEDEMPRLQGELDFLKIQLISKDEVITGARDLSTRWPKLAFEDKRAVIEQLVERITIGNGTVHIQMLYLPTPSEVAAKKQRNFRDSSPLRARTALETSCLRV
ncbi:MAG: recombinase family protein, partial [Candidatus Eisenbacteria bacterium]